MRNTKIETHMPWTPTSNPTMRPDTGMVYWNANQPGCVLPGATGGLELFQKSVPSDRVPTTSAETVVPGLDTA